MDGPGRPTSAGIRVPGRPATATRPGTTSSLVMARRQPTPGPCIFADRKLGTSNRGKTEVGVQVDLGGAEPESVTIRLFPGSRIEGVGDPNSPNPNYVPCILPKGYATSVGAILRPYNDSMHLAALVPLEAVSKKESSKTTCCTGKKHGHKNGHPKNTHYNVNGNGNNGQERGMQHFSHQHSSSTGALASTTKTCRLM